MKLRNNFKPSPLQLLLASKNGIKVPDGYTYKKAHSWGRKEMAEAEVIYRSRNLTGLFFESESYKVKAREIVDMSPLKFEEYCVKVIEKLNWNTTVSRPKDGGIDIEAYKDNSKGEVVRLFAQCKHHKNNINPNILRELLGSKECENNDFITELMIITSGKFSSGCSEIANEKNIILIDGNDLLKLNVKNILN
jgi:predicted Mrr-cat superfamily restriction endonuclease